MRICITLASFGTDARYRPADQGPALPARAAWRTAAPGPAADLRRAPFEVCVVVDAACPSKAGLAFGQPNAGRPSDFKRCACPMRCRHSMSRRRGTRTSARSPARPSATCWRPCWPSRSDDRRRRSRLVIRSRLPLERGTAELRHRPHGCVRSKSAPGGTALVDQRTEVAAMPARGRRVAVRSEVARRAHAGSLKRASLVA